MANTALIQVTDAATIGTVSYNGYTFPPSRQTSLSCSPVYDEAGVHIVATRYQYRVHFFVVSNDESNESDALNTIRTQLSEPGGALIIKDVGLGDIDTTPSSGNQADVMYGPTPRLLSFVPLGGFVAAEIVWDVEFTINDCSPTPVPYFTSLSYTTRFGVAANGLATRTINGSLTTPTRHPVSLAATGTLPQSIDNLVDYLTIEVPPNFRRQSFDRQISPDYSKITFSVVDVEFSAEAFPEGIVSARGTFSFRNTRPIQFSQWSANLSCQLEIAPDKPMSWAAVKFFAIMVQYLSKLNQYASAHGGGNVIPQHLAFGRELWGRNTEFSVSFQINVTKPAGSQQIMAPSGVWDEVPNTNYAAYKTSMQSLWGPKGLSKTDHRPDLDQPSSVSGCSASPTVAIGNTEQEPFTIGSATPAFFDCNQISPENSWLAYENRLEYFQSENASYVSPAQNYIPQPESGNDDAQISDGDGGVTFEQPQSQGQILSPSQVYYRGEPKRYVLMRGKGMRVSHQVTPPTLATVDGVPVTMIRKHNTQSDRVGDVFGCPVYAASWSQLYVILGTPSRGENPKKNPTMQD